MGRKMLIENYIRLQYKATKVNNRHAAKCLVCGETISNTAIGRMLRHRKVCPLPGVQEYITYIDPNKCNFPVVSGIYNVNPSGVLQLVQSYESCGTNGVILRLLDSMNIPIRFVEERKGKVRLHFSVIIESDGTKLICVYVNSMVNFGK